MMSTVTGFVLGCLPGLKFSKWIVHVGDGKLQGWVGVVRTKGVVGNSR